MKIISYWSKLLSDLNMYHFAESENKCFIKKPFVPGVFVWNFCISFIFSGQYENMDFSQILILRSTLKNFLHFLCISGINFLVHWTKKSFFMFYWIFCLLLFLNCLKMSTNKSGTIFLFTINTFESIQTEWSGNQEMSRTKKII